MTMSPNPANAAARHYLNPLGVQLWTVRDALGADAAATLAAVRHAGYAQVELMRLADARDLSARARDAGLGVTSAFLEWELLASPGPDNARDLANALQTAVDLQLRYLVFGYIGKGRRETAALLGEHAARANVFGRDCRAAGIQLCYHHHAFEFAPLDARGTTGWSTLLAAFDPALVQLELDTFWLALGGLDPVATIRALRGRVAQVHLKDLASGTAQNWDEGAIPPDAFRELGRGIIDLPGVLVACAETGVAQCHVEQDQSADPLASIRVSRDYLQRLARA